MTWFYQNKIFTMNNVDNHHSFVYKITNVVNNKKYFGKKKFNFITTKKPLKGKTRKRKQIKPSDWETYYGSCQELIDDVEKYGKENFHREILRLCETVSDSSYYELKYQMENDVLLKPDEYYNSFVGGKINRKQMRVK